MSARLPPLTELDDELLELELLEELDTDDELELLLDTLELLDETLELELLELDELELDTLELDELELVPPVMPYTSNSNNE